MKLFRRTDLAPPGQRAAYREDIDGLRAVAVLSVVLFHYDETLLPGGFLGVDLFFVLSGYLISGILYRELAEGRFSLLRFYARRARRILPALLTVILAVLAGAYWLAPPEDAARIAVSALAALGFAANFHFRDQADYFAISPAEEPLLHTWSLAVEEQFYLVWPLLLALLATPIAARLGRRRLWVGGAALLLAWLAALWLSVWMPSVAFYHLPARVWELGAGALVAAMGPLRLGARPAGALVGLGLALILGSALWLDQSWPTPALSAFPTVLGTSLILAIGASAGGAGPAGLLRSAPARGIGLISYALYLWHWPVLSFLKALNPEPGWGALAAGIALAFALAAATYALIEQPARRRWRFLAGDRPALGWALAGMALTALLAVSATMTGGWPWRAPEGYAAAMAALRPEPPAISGRCFNAYAPEKDPGCDFGAGVGGPPFDLLLIGDSHANHYVPAIAPIARAEGLSARLVAGGGCPPLFGVTTRKWSDRGLCDGYRAAVDAAIRRSPDARAIILAARWAFYFEPLDADGAPPHRFVTIDGESRADLPFAEHFGRAEAALSGMLDRLLAETGATVILLDQAPPLKRSAASCARRALWLGEDPDRCRSDAAAAERRLERTRAALRRLAAEKGDRVRFAPLGDALCDARFCRGVEGGRLLYHDDNHLSAHGARLVGERAGFAAILREALRRD